MHVLFIGVCSDFCASVCVLLYMHYIMNASFSDKNKNKSKLNQVSLLQLLPKSP